MNANPAYCDCERCEIDRERSPHRRAWRTAFREATMEQVSAGLDTVESGRHHDSPEADGALLALTGLMLEKESELSGAMVGRAVGQQDQGEETPMSAAETERRISLMGRLNDAAARLRQRPAPEVADHDAEPWYAARFACITSLQVVRLFRRQRAELPQGDLMGEAYLVVLVQLATEAEESRERLEDTAIPDLDDGLTDARGALLAETVAADLREFNQDLPMEIRPAMQGLPAVTERAAAWWLDRLTSTADASTSGTPTRRTPRADCTSSTTTARPKWSSRYWTPTRWGSRRRPLSSRLTG